MASLVIDYRTDDVSAIIAGVATIFYLIDDFCRAVKVNAGRVPWLLAVSSSTYLHKTVDFAEVCMALIDLLFPDCR